MPGNLLFADKQFPNVSGSAETDLKAILNYLYMLQEELRYTMGNVGIENFNTTELTALSAMILGDESIAQIQAKADEQGASITLLTAYTGLAEVEEVDSAAEFTDTAKTYKIGTSYYRYDGTDWIDDTSISSASLTLAAINGQSTAVIKADRIINDGAVHFIVSDDLGEEGTTDIYGGLLMTGSVYTDVLASAADGDGNTWISMTAGLDFGNSTVMDYEDAAYTPATRGIAGIQVIRLEGDTDLTSGGNGTSGNGPTLTTGHLENKQSPSGADIVQYGIEVGSRRDLFLVGQCYGAAADGTGVFIESVQPDTTVNNQVFFELCVEDSGIRAYKWQSDGAGNLTQLGTATILS